MSMFQEIKHSVLQEKRPVPQRRNRQSTQSILSGMDITQLVIEKIDEDEKEQIQSPIKLQPPVADQTSSSNDDSTYLRKVQEQRELEERKQLEEYGSMRLILDEESNHRVSFQKGFRFDDLNLSSPDYKTPIIQKDTSTGLGQPANQPKIQLIMTDNK